MYEIVQFEMCIHWVFDIYDIKKYVFCVWFVKYIKQYTDSKTWVKENKKWP